MKAVLLIFGQIRGIRGGPSPRDVAGGETNSYTRVYIPRRCEIIKGNKPLFRQLFRQPLNSDMKGAFAIVPIATYTMDGFSGVHGPRKSHGFRQRTTTKITRMGSFLTWGGTTGYRVRSMGLGNMITDDHLLIARWLLLGSLAKLRRKTGGGDG